ncbi:metallophosphoesterase [Candidatus Sumerlaeota bacterium]|nr:metallophosphoesterase [Candidatus Sumerlaeota bacterium]
MNNIQPARKKKPSQPQRTRAWGRVIILILCGVFIIGCAIGASPLILGHFIIAVKNTYNFITLIYPALCALGGAVLFMLWRQNRGVRFLLRSSMAAFIIGLALIALRVWATHIEPRNLRVRHVEFHSPKVSQPLRILHISDIQSPAVGAYEEKAVRMMAQLQPDLVLHTGDLVQPSPPYSHATEWPKIGALLDEQLPGVPRYGVYGDTDGRERRRKAEFGGMRWLANCGETITIKGARIRLYGLTLVESARTHALPDNALNWLHSAPPDALKIIFGHRPDYILAAQEHPLDLCLAGHTHGGQICVPGFGPLVTLSAVPRDWARGYHVAGRTRFNCSAGIGCEHNRGVPSIRLFCPPEMTLITLLPEEKSPQ